MGYLELNGFPIVQYTLNNPTLLDKLIRLRNNIENSVLVSHFLFQSFNKHSKIPECKFNAAKFSQCPQLE